ncbi:50S ribosomal protein L1 [Buchnera aphidicola]|uniref:Large ribosomal subunit protein uL1 n=1 Tax=Buchnera aphidicola subsp. Tuberolachnus salignus TaxID=98804 RepID=A0A160SWA4_BUCTT|nr:50S ribosomal protein L1 [Buchnera aphidicola]CUR53012.1 50S ribosomal protein L1 [Buchnera aphidicola (Tuberolachnus salignus)]
MKFSSKRHQNNTKMLIKKKIYDIKEGIKFLKKFKKTKFSESVDLACQINIDPKKTEQNIRGTIILPHGTGKTIKIAVFAPEEKKKIALQSGADLVGLEDLLEILKTQKKNIDFVLATPESMNFVKNLGPILGPQGLMPNYKDGTITNDLPQIIHNLKKGTIKYRNDKNGIIHSSIGKIQFPLEKLYENILFFLKHIKKSKPNQLKGFYFKKINLSTTMSPGIIINHLSI